MSTGLLKKDIKIGIEEEVTEGTYVAPSGATAYLRPEQDGWACNPVREELPRTVATGKLGMLPARRGVKSANGNIQVEVRGEGNEGVAPDYAKLIKNAMGAEMSVASETTSTTGHTSTVINLSNGDGAKFEVGDIVIVKESGAYEARPISAVSTTVDANSITFPFALDNGAPSNGVVITKAVGYKTANSGHTALSLSFYVGNTMRLTSIGSKVSSMAIENWTAGQLPKFNFGFEGLRYGDLTDGAAPHTPTFDSDLGPVIAMKACLYVAGATIEYNSMSLSLNNTLAAIMDACNEHGRSGLRVVSREITGTIAQYMDDTSTDAFDKFVDGDTFGLFAYGYVPSSTAGEITLGTMVGLWLPKVQYNGYSVADIDQIHTNELPFRSVIDDSSSNEEMYLGFV